jgi:hypothetical protein
MRDKRCEYCKCHSRKKFSLDLGLPALFLMMLISFFYTIGGIEEAREYLWALVR